MIEQKKNASPVPEPLMTKNELQNVLRISSRTLGRLIESGEIPQPIRVGQRPRWRVGDVNRCLAAAPAAASGKQ
jgi:predicted DNA-binding transcriptional regulator AlpA